LDVDNCAVADVVLDGHARAGVINLLGVMIVNLELDGLALGSCGPGYDGVGGPLLGGGSRFAGVDDCYTVAEVDIEALGVILVPGDGVVGIDVPHLVGVAGGAGVSLNGVSVSIRTISNIKTLVAKDNEGAGRSGSGGRSSLGDDPRASQGVDGAASLARSDKTLSAAGV